MSKNWFITGASSGFGRAMSEKLLARGDRVAATVRREGTLDDLKDAYGDLLVVGLLDVTDVAGIRKVMAEAFAALGRIDVVVSNAAYILSGAAEEYTDAQINQQIETNLVGSIQTVRAALPYLRAQGGGRIIQLSSEAGQAIYPNYSMYHAVKWGVEGFVECVAKEVAPFNIDCTIVEPGAANTSLKANRVKAPVLDVYNDTPAGDMRRAVESGEFAAPGDTDRIAQAIIDSTDQKPAPLRLVFGARAYTSITTALAARLADVETQKETAEATDVRP